MSEAENNQEGQAPAAGADGAAAGQAGAAGQVGAAGAPPSGDAGQPITYDLKWDEKLAPSAELTGQFTAAFAKHSIAPEAAQAIVDLLPGGLEAAQGVFQQALDSQHAEQVKAWEAEARSAPDIGGAKFDASVAASQAALARFGDDEVRALLDASGFGSHPAFIRLFAKVSAQIAEGQHVGGGNAPAAPSAAESLYTHPTSRKALKFG